MKRERLLSALKRIVGDDGVLTSKDDLVTYGQDWTRFYTPNPTAVVLPRKTEEVSEILQFCSDSDISVVPSGGRTGLAGGAVATHKELVLSLSRLTTLGAVDAVSSTVRVGAGVVTEHLHEHCKKNGFLWPIDLAAKGSCQIGGNVATNAGGLRVIRYGHTRNWVQSLKVCLANGEVWELNGDLEKNNSGYDFRHLFIGSEGTLGVVTEATLRLTTPPRDSIVLFLAVPTVAAALQLLASARRGPFKIQAFEIMTSECLDVSRAVTGTPLPVSRPSPYYILMDVEPFGAVDTWLETILPSEFCSDAIMARSSDQAHTLWALRENITEGLARKGTVYKNDLSLPISALSEFVDAFHAQSSRWYPNCEVFVFGHVGDGNLHVNVLKPPRLSVPEFISLCEESNDPLFQLVQKHRGSIVAEHGIGLLKKRYLSYTRSKNEIEAMRKVKKVFDPAGILNPGKIFD